MNEWAKFVAEGALEELKLVHKLTVPMDESWTGQNVMDCGDLIKGRYVEMYPEGVPLCPGCFPSKAERDFINNEGEYPTDMPASWDAEQPRWLPYMTIPVEEIFNYRDEEEEE